MVNPVVMSRDMVLAADSEARLSSRRTRVVVRCPSCGEDFVAGGRHIGSAYCAIRTRQRSHWRAGREQLPAKHLATALAAGLEVVHDESGGLDYAEGAYRKAAPKAAHFGARWAVALLARTQRMQRARRVLLLQAMQDERLAEARAYLLTSRRVEWALDAFSHERRGPSRARVVDVLVLAWEGEARSMPWVGTTRREEALATLASSERGAL